MTVLGIGRQGRLGGILQATARTTPRSLEGAGIATSRPARRFIGSTVLALLWGAAVFLWPATGNVNLILSSDHGAGESLYKSAPVTRANLGMMGVRMYQSSEGRKRWAIRSDFAELHRKENYSFLENVTAEFTAERTGNVVVTKSKYGRAQLDKENVDLEGNVSIRSKRGYLFTMERLHYDGTSHLFTSDDPVKMQGPSVTQPRMILRGVGLMAEIDDEHFYLHRNVTAMRRIIAEPKEEKQLASAAPKETRWLRISSRSGEFFTEEQRSIFIAKVHAQLPKLELDGDVVELSVADEKESMQAQGNVVLRSRGRIGRAETAYLELDSNRIVLEGKARVDAKDNQVRGRRILLYTDEDRVEVEQAEGSGRG